MRSRALQLLLLSTLLTNEVFCDGNHAHSASVSTTSDAAPGPATGSATSVHSSSHSSDGATNDAFASIIKTVSQNPELAAAAAAAGYSLPPSPQGGYDLPPPPAEGPRRPPIHGFPGGFGLPLGFGKGFNVNVDGGVGGGYFPIIEKAVVIVGGGILILLIIAFIQGSLAAGGFLHSLFGSFSKAVAGSVNVDVGPIHKSASGAAAVNVNDRIGVNGGRLNDPQFNSRVIEGVERRF